MRAKGSGCIAKVSPAPPPSRRLRSVALHRFAQQDGPRVDLPRELVLPDDMRAEQAEVFGVGEEVRARSFKWFW